MTISGQQLISHWSGLAVSTLIMGISLDGLAVPCVVSWLAFSLSTSLLIGLYFSLVYYHYHQSLPPPHLRIISQKRKKPYVWK